MLAIGLLASSLTQNQVVSAVLGIGINLVLWVSGDLGDVVGETLRPVVEYLPLFAHYSDFALGVIDSGEIVYYLSTVILCLFISTRMVESRRWR